MDPGSALWPLPSNSSPVTLPTVAILSGEPWCEQQETCLSEVAVFFVYPVLLSTSGAGIRAFSDLVGFLDPHRCGR